MELLDEKGTRLLNDGRDRTNRIVSPSTCFSLFFSLKLEIKAQVEEYARQKAEEHAILQAARHARHHQEKEANKITAEEAAKIQERVSMICDRNVMQKVGGSYTQRKKSVLRDIKQRLRAGLGCCIS